MPRCARTAHLVTKPLKPPLISSVTSRSTRGSRQIAVLPDPANLALKRTRPGSCKNARRSRNKGAAPGSRAASAVGAPI